MKSIILSLGVLSSIVATVAATNGKATTTRYSDGLDTACGCSPSSVKGMNSNAFYTAAVNQGLFGGTSSWCGGGCGKCYKLTSTGTAPKAGTGTGGKAGQSILVIVTDLCPTNGNEEWCSEPGGSNKYGYNYHFDIMAPSEVFGDNPVVDFEETPCPTTASSVFGQCKCPQGAYSGSAAAAKEETKTETTSAAKKPESTPETKTEAKYEPEASYETKTESKPEASEEAKKSGYQGKKGGKKGSKGKFTPEQKVKAEEEVKTEEKPAQGASCPAPKHRRHSHQRRH